MNDNNQNYDTRVWHHKAMAVNDSQHESGAVVVVFAVDICLRGASVGLDRATNGLTQCYGPFEKADSTTSETCSLFSKRIPLNGY